MHCAEWMELNNKIKYAPNMSKHRIDRGQGAHRNLTVDRKLITQAAEPQKRRDCQLSSTFPEWKIEDSCGHKMRQFGFQRTTGKSSYLHTAPDSVRIRFHLWKYWFNRREYPHNRKYIPLTWKHTPHPSIPLSTNCLSPSAVAFNIRKAICPYTY